MLLVDLDDLTAGDLIELAAIKADVEARLGEQRCGRLAHLLWKPALGAYLACPVMRLKRCLR